MYRFIFTTLLLLGAASFNAQAESCSATKYVEQQCIFEIPVIEDGEQFTATFSNSGLIGGVVAQCDSGTVSFAASICKPADKSACIVPETVWGGKDEYCSHSSLPGVLENGVEKVALSESEMDGRIVYLCEDGKLTQKTSFCTPGSVQGNALENDEEIFGIYRKDCNTAEVIGKVLGQRDEDVRSALCVSANFTVLDEVMSSEPYPSRPDGDDYYHVEALCSNNIDPDTQCETPIGDTGSSADFIHTVDCDRASVSGVVNSPNTNRPNDSMIESALCVFNGFSTLDNVVNVEWIDNMLGESGGTSYLVEAECSGNANQESMCQADTGDYTVSVLDCDSASITGDIDGRYKVSETVPPTESEVQQALCVTNGYASLKQVTNILFTPSGMRGFYEVSAICESNTAPTENCKNSCMGRLVSSGSALPKILGSDGLYYEDTCVIDPQPPEGFCQDCENADITFIDSNTGNTCSLVDQNILTGENKDIDFADANFNGTVNVSCNSSQFSVISGECYKTCKGGSRAVWRDKNGANSCGAVIPAGDYYQDETVSLGTDINNGSSVFRCDDGEWVEDGPSQCLLDCSGSFNWGSGVSANGVNKNGICRATLGLLKHTASTNKIVSTTPYTDGETDASCNDGTITTSNSSCDLDCRSEVGYWGGGRCSTTVPDTDHQAVANVTTPAPLTGYSGTAAFTCGDGDFSLGGSTCFQDCPEQNLSMNMCSYTASASKHDAKAPYVLSNSTTEANIVHTCTDGGWVRSSDSYCTNGSLQYGAWSAWSNVGGRYSHGSWTPPQSDYYTDESFTQTRSFKQNQARTRDVYRVFTPSNRRDFVRTETANRALNDSESRVVNGTKVRSSLVWADTGRYNSEYPYDPDAAQVTNVPGCTAFNGDAAPEVNLGDSCSREGEFAYFAFECNFEDDYCQGQTGDNCTGDYFADGYIAVCGSGLPPVDPDPKPDPEPDPDPTDPLSECVSVERAYENYADGFIETGTGMYAGCEGTVTLSINVKGYDPYNLDPDGVCDSDISGDSIEAYVEPPSDWIVNEQYMCDVEVDFIFTRGTETFTISTEVRAEFSEACQVDTGTNRC